MGFGGKGKGGGKFGGGKGYDDGGYGGGSKGGKSKGGKGKGRTGASAPGVAMVDGRIELKMKSYSKESQWGFAITDSNEYGDIFIHKKNLDRSMRNFDFTLREGDVVEVSLEEVDGKPVGKDITVVGQDPSLFDGQFMKGKVTSHDESSGWGVITSPRIFGNINFSSDECAASLDRSYADADVMFRLSVESGEGLATFVNPLWEMSYKEGYERACGIIDVLGADGLIDEKAVTTLKDSDPTTFMKILPDLDLYKAENPSSFILGALSRQRKEEMGDMDKGFGKGGGWDDWGKGSKGKGGKGKGGGGKGWGKSSWGPY